MTVRSPVHFRIGVAALCGLGIACSRGLTIDYRVADPVLDARRAVLDSGHFHLLAVKVGDSVIALRDASVLKQERYTVEVGPEGAVIFLRFEPAPGNPRAPSDPQLLYIMRYNTELLALLDTNAMSEEPRLDR